MTDDFPYSNDATSVSAPSDTIPQRRALLEAVVAQWGHGSTPDARKALNEHPSLAADRSLAIELAYIEYCRRRQAGDSLSTAEFCRRFPEIERSLLDAIEIDSFLSNNSHLLGTDSAARWPSIGDVVEGFELLEELGRGAFSRVFLARQTPIGGRFVALKACIHDVREADFLGRLEHPHIMPLYSVHRDPASSLTYLCMPLLGRATLAVALDELRRLGGVPGDDRVFARCAGRTRMDDALVSPAKQEKGRAEAYVDAVLRLGANLADGLQHAHQRSVLHLDLKPSNVLLAYDGRPLIVDFNLSADARDRQRRLGGTLPYMAPEVLRGVATASESQAELGGRSDLFSLAVLLYELLTLKRPFPAERFDQPLQRTAQEQLRRISDGCPPLRSLNPWVDAATARAIEQCLATDPERRPESAQALATELRRLLSCRSSLRRRLLRHPRTIVASAVIALAATAGAATALMMRQPDERRRFQIGQESLAAGRHDEALEHFAAVLQIQPHHADALSARGIALAGKGLFDEAARSFESAIRLHPTPLGWAGLSYCQARRKEWSKAIDSARSFLAAGGRDTRVLSNLAYTYISLKRWKEAEDVVSAACQESDAPAAAFFNRAVLEARQALADPNFVPQRGIDDLQHVLQMGCHQGEVYLQLGLLQVLAAKKDVRRFDDALSSLQRALELGAPQEVVRSFAPLFREAGPNNRLEAILDTVPTNAKAFAFDQLTPPF